MVRIIKISRKKAFQTREWWRDTNMPFWQWVEHTRTTKINWWERQHTAHEPRMYVWTSKLKLMVTIHWNDCNTRTVCPKYWDADALDELEGAAHSCCCCSASLGNEERWRERESSNHPMPSWWYAYRADGELGMLRRLIWSIMHKSTCFNFAWKTNQYLANF